MQLLNCLPLVSPMGLTSQPASQPLSINCVPSISHPLNIISPFHVPLNLNIGLSPSFSLLPSVPLFTLSMFPVLPNIFPIISRTQVSSPQPPDANIGQRNRLLFLLLTSFIQSLSLQNFSVANKTDTHLMVTKHFHRLYTHSVGMTRNTPNNTRDPPARSLQWCAAMAPGWRCRLGSGGRGPSTKNQQANIFTMFSDFSCFQNSFIFAS